MIQNDYSKKLKKLTEFGKINIMDEETAVPQPHDQPQHPIKRRAIRGFLGVALLINIITWVLILWKIPPTDNTVFLHYNIYFGIDRTGSWWQLLVIPGSGAVILLLNTAIILLFKKLDALVAALLSALTLGLQMMSLVAAIFVILLNI